MAFAASTLRHSSLLVLALAACSASDEGGEDGLLDGSAGSAAATGGASATTGGAAAQTTGGVSTTTGGMPATGGMLPTGGVPTTGGTVTTGGTAPTGGTSPTGGGVNTGGVVATGGMPSTGGTEATGGIAAAGGSTETNTGGSAGDPTGGSAGGGTGGVPEGTGGVETGGTSGSDTGGSDTGGSSTGGNGECPTPAPGTSGTNPLFTDDYTADPAPLVHDCTFYIVCGHDEGNTGFVINEWFLLKSTDMVNWTKTQALSLNDFSWAPINAWASHLATRNGKFYWYVPIAEGGNGAMTIGVAVADDPEGPYTDAIGGPLVNDAYEMEDMGLATPEDTPFTIDPAVFIDDDGQAYLYYGGFWRMIVAPLAEDMISLTGPLQQTTPQGFFEAPFIFKREGVYYNVYAGESNPAPIYWSTASSPLGPWTFGGTVLDPLPDAGPDPATSHPGVAEFAGQWYLVYHLSDGPNGGGTYRREVAVDKLYFDGDGSIQQVVPTSGLTF